MPNNLRLGIGAAPVVSKPDTKNIRTRLKALCTSKELSVKNNDDQIPALLDLLDPKKNEDNNDEEGPFI